jgi:hypothetical protein
MSCQSVIPIAPTRGVKCKTPEIRADLFGLKREFVKTVIEIENIMPKKRVAIPG